MEFSQRLKHVREHRGLSQNALAKASGVSQAIVQRLEAGTRKMDYLTVAVALRLAKALNVSMDYLCGRWEDENLTEGAVVVWIGVWRHNGHESYAMNGHALLPSIAKGARSYYIDH